MKFFDANQVLENSNTSMEFKSIYLILIFISTPQLYATRKFDVLCTRSQLCIQQILNYSWKVENDLYSFQSSEDFDTKLFF